jgi:hypothetical protein
LLARYSRPPARLDVECHDVHAPWLHGDARFGLEISWTNRTAIRSRRVSATFQAGPIVEMAATAIALVLAHKVLRLGQLDVTKCGDRTDFRSTRFSCMLEVSGTESLRELGRRHREKILQATSNPLGWDSYVVVCAFSSRGHRVRLSSHHARGSADG